MTILAKPNWSELVTTSHIETVEMVRRLVEDQEYEEAVAGLLELEENMSQLQRKALKSHLVRLMMHLLNWRYQPDKHSTSWTRTIVNARIEIRDAREVMPSLNEPFIESIWEKDFQDAIAQAKAEMNLSRKDIFEPASLTWEEVFEDEYLV